MRVTRILRPSVWRSMGLETLRVLSIGYHPRVRPGQTLTASYPHTFREYEAVSGQLRSAISKQYERSWPIHWIATELSSARSRLRTRLDDPMRLACSLALDRQFRYVPHSSLTSTLVHAIVAPTWCSIFCAGCSPSS